MDRPTLTAEENWSAASEANEAVKSSRFWIYRLCILIIAIGLPGVLWLIGISPDLVAMLLAIGLLFSVLTLWDVARSVLRYATSITISHEAIVLDRRRWFDLLSRTIRWEDLNYVKVPMHQRTCQFLVVGYDHRNGTARDSEHIVIRRGETELDLGYIAEVIVAGAKTAGIEPAFHKRVDFGQRHYSFQGLASANMPVGRKTIIKHYDFMSR